MTSSLPVEARERLVLLPGFASSPALFRALADALAPRFDVQILALPAQGAAPLAEFSEAVLLDHLASQIPAKAWLMGWSLGAMLAVRLAPRVGAAGVICLGANASFIAREDYPAAMDRMVNRAFNDSFAAAPEAALKRFCALIALGDGRELAAQLRAAAPPFDAQWCDYLALLARLDNRAALAALKCPCVHLLAAADALVPVTAAAALKADFPAHHVKVLEGSHAGLVLHPARVANALFTELREVIA